MRFNGLVLVAAIAALSACGGDKAGSDTSAAAAPPAGGTPSTTPSTTTTAAAPVTGTWHEVKMVADGQVYKFDKTDITIKAGDGVRWIMVSGAPHNVAFQNVAPDAKGQLAANMPNQMAELTGPMLLNPNEKYEMSFANVKPGKYEYVCQPHLATNMRGSITVQ
jgi:plastocyanin